MEQERGTRGPERPSRVSHDVAHKVARAAEFERAIESYADELGTSMEERFFPDGLPQPFTVQILLAALRERLEQALAQAGDGSSEGIDARIEALEHEMHVVASLYSGFAGIARKTDLAGEIADLAALPEPPV
jgi:hypothetical protein